jgi:hypothetical protein
MTTMTTPEFGSIEAEFLLQANLLQVLAGTHDFAVSATPRKLNCTKSHFCIGKTNRGGCVALTKACVFPAKGAAFMAAQAVQAGNPKAAKKTKTTAAASKAAANPAPQQSKAANTAASSDQARLQSLKDALDSGDIEAMMDAADDIDKAAAKVKLASGEYDRVLKYLYKASGYDGLPQVGTEADLDQAIEDGATMMARGVNRGRPPGALADQFRTGDYFVGNGIYGNGTYTGHSGGIDAAGNFVPGSTASGLKRAIDDVAKHDYISAQVDTLRMALPKDAKVVTQSKLAEQAQAVDLQIDAWVAAEKVKIGGAPPLTAAEIVKNASFKSLFVSPNRSTAEFVDGDGKIQKLLMKKTVYSASYWDEDAGTFSDDYPDERSALAGFLAATGSKYTSASAPAKGKTSTSKYKNAAEVEKRAQALKEMLWGDSDGSPPGDGYTWGSGRFATIKGYDAVALDRSYESETFMLALNRRKTIVQDTNLDFADAQSRGLGRKRTQADQDKIDNDLLDSFLADLDSFDPT